MLFSTEGQSLIFLSMCTRSNTSFFLLLNIQSDIHLQPPTTFTTNQQNTKQPFTQPPITSIIMSSAYEGQDPIAIAKQAEADLNSQGAKHGHRVDDTARGPAGASDSSKSPSL